MYKITTSYDLEEHLISKEDIAKYILLSQAQYNTCITKSNISLSHCAIYEMYLQIMLILAFLYKKEACKICQLTTD